MPFPDTFHSLLLSGAYLFVDFGQAVSPPSTDIEDFVFSFLLTCFYESIEVVTSSG